MDEMEITKHVTVQAGLLHVRIHDTPEQQLEIPESNRLRILGLTAWHECCSGELDCVLSA